MELFDTLLKEVDARIEKLAARVESGEALYEEIVLLGRLEEARELLYEPGLKLGSADAVLASQVRSSGAVWA